MCLNGTNTKLRKLGGCSPQKKPKKTKKKPSQFTNFGVATGFFWFFFGFFLVFFGFFLAFFVFFWDDILTLNLNTKKTKKSQKKPKKTKKPVSNFECWPRSMPKKTKKNQKKPKKTKKKQKKPKKTSFQFRILAKTNAKKNQKKPKKTKKTNANLEI